MIYNIVANWKMKSCKYILQWLILRVKGTDILDLGIHVEYTRTCGVKRRVDLEVYKVISGHSVHLFQYDL